MHLRRLLTIVLFAFAVVAGYAPPARPVGASARPPAPATASDSPGSAMSEAEVLEDLPAEMQQAVFSHLDLPSVRALRRASHAVRALIGSRDFQKARHSVRSEPAHPSPACSLEACIHRQSSMPRAAPTFGPPLLISRP